jgi:hypothetical protein
VLDGSLDEAAALAGPGQAVNSLDRGFLQDYIDALCHGSYALMIFIHIIYTRWMYVTKLRLFGAATLKPAFLVLVP